MDSVWKSYLKLKRLALVPRSGFYLCEVVERPTRAQMLAESVLEHSAGASMLLTDLISYFTEFEDEPLLENYDPLIAIKTMQIHDVAEAEIGDVPDDGSIEHDRKQVQEQLLIGNYIKTLLPPGQAEKVWALYREFVEHRTHDGIVLYLTDKLEAILQLLVYETYGAYGSVYLKQPPSKQDVEFAEQIGTGRCVDVWAYHFYQMVQDCPMKAAGPFCDLLRTAVIDVRGNWFEWWT